MCAHIPAGRSIAARLHADASQGIQATQQGLLRGLDALARIGVKPRGYRAPGWDVSAHTLDLLEELGFTWDSSLMANDLHPYYPRRVTRPSTVKHGRYEVADRAS